MTDFSPVLANDLSGCIAGCTGFLSTQNKGADFVQLLRKIAAEQGNDPNVLSAERAAVFIRSYEKKIGSIAQDGVLDRQETCAILSLLGDELSAARQAIFKNATTLSQADIERANYFGNEARECRGFAKKLEM